MASIGLKSPPELGPIDRYATKIDLETFIDMRKKTREQNIYNVLWKQRTKGVHQFLTRWVYESHIPFHSISQDSFERFVETVGQFGLGYKLPSQYQLRELLSEK